MSGSKYRGSRRNNTSPDKNAVKGQEAITEIADRLGDLFGKVRDVVERAENNLDGIQETTEFGDKKGLHGVAGLKINVGGASFREGQTIKANDLNKEGRTAATEQRETTRFEFDVVDVGDRLLVTTSLDGISEPSLSVHFDHDNANLLVTISDIEHTIDIEPTIISEQPSFGVRNGILQIDLIKSILED